MESLSRSVQQELTQGEASLAMVTSWPDALPREVTCAAESVWVSDSLQAAQAVRTLGNTRALGAVRLPETAAPACVEIQPSGEVSVSTFRVGVPAL